MVSPGGQCWAPSSLFCTLMTLCKITKVVHFVFFADDTNIFCSGDNLQILQNDITLEMNKLKKNGLIKNKLSLNLSKTIIMRFGNFEPNTQLIVKTEGVKIERVHEIQFLGVIIDDGIN